MQTYKDALEKLGTRDSRKLANNTYLQRQPDGSIAVRLHSTNVVTFESNGTVVLTSGGWKTPTTKDRINNYSPVRVSQTRGIWYAYNGNGWENAVPFADGMKYRNGKFTGIGDDPRKQDKLRAKVRKFAGEYMRKLAAGEIPAPGSGDCWGCLMQTEKGERPMGGKDHMLSHLEEQYFVPVMIQRAFETFGAAPVQFWGLGSIWGKTPGAEGFRQYATDARAKRMLTRFIYRELGLAA